MSPTWLPQVTVWIERSLGHSTESVGCITCKKKKQADVQQSSHLTTYNFVTCDFRTKVAVQKTVIWGIVECSRVKRYRSWGKNLLLSSSLLKHLP
jgi:hypothetical protein